MLKKTRMTSATFENLPRKVLFKNIQVVDNAEKINGKKVRTLEDVSDAFKLSPEYFVIEFLGRGRPLVLERKAVSEARERILRGYGVSSEEYLGDSIVPESWVKTLSQEDG